ncbi:MAG: type 3 dihydrofolate reductase [Pseudomonadota bacterium]|jgi:dihydrofolate reductase|nr:type 3 dihydrofolate reductase [Pseudomonadota bacterium]|tara:strand:+ start:1678 stop:2163 length:486 start_codon:yes stop_codon:yes gene_type:complete
MQLSIIVAMDKNRVIGKDGTLPWHISSDLKNFKKITMGKPILMGRKTHESIARPLPGRENIILTKNQNYFSEGCVVKNNLDEVFSYCEKVTELMVMGGATLYEQTLDKAEKLYVTEVRASIDGDTFFPEYDPDQWTEIAKDSFKADENNEYDYSFTVLERK